MAKKKVLIVEDDKKMAARLRYRLEACGFEVYSTHRVAEARKLAEEYWDELDVIVLDMELKDPDEPDTKGAEIGIALRRALRTKPSPEFIIYSGFDFIDYYRLAVQLRAAAYLEKQKHYPADLIRHVKVLALSHALSIENSAMTKRIDRIATHSETPRRRSRNSASVSSGRSWKIACTRRSSFS